ncbi:MAG: GNAT family N-acetyltransferase [Nakamurella sp.]
MTRLPVSAVGDRGVTQVASNYEIGLALIPEHRGQGIGTVAQQLIVDYLLDHTTAHRIEAITNDGNVGEQNVLQRLGFQLEGLCTVGRSCNQISWRTDVLAAARGRAPQPPAVTIS